VNVTSSTDDDLGYIIQWLKEQFDDVEGIGFWGNRNLIRRSHEEDRDMWVVREGGNAIAFQIGKYSPDITCVKDTHQGNGYGTALFKAGLERAYSDGVVRLSGDCMPETSLPFWQKMGFRQTAPSGGIGRGIPVEMWLPKSLTLPEGEEALSVEVELFVVPERALYGKAVEPLAKAKPQARLLKGQTRVYLAERFHIPDREEASGDPALRVLVNGEQIYFDKAKYPEAAQLGVQFDPLGNRFMDFLNVPALCVSITTETLSQRSLRAGQVLVCGPYLPRYCSR